MPSAWQKDDVGSTKSEERRKNVKLFFLYLLSHALIYAFGMVAFHLLEGWDMGDAAYFCFVVLSTCGFGDFTPKTFWGRAFFILYATFCIPILVFNLAKMAHVVFSGAKLFRRKVLCGKHMEGKGCRVGCYNYWVSPEDRLGLNMTCMMTVLAVASPLISYIEGWDFGTGFYFIFQTMTTIGFGDITAQSTAGRLVMVSAGYFSIGILSDNISLVTTQASKGSSKAARQKDPKQKELRKVVPVNSSAAKSKSGAI